SRHSCTTRRSADLLLVRLHTIPLCRHIVSGQRSARHGPNQNIPPECASVHTSRNRPRHTALQLFEWLSWAISMWQGFRTGPQYLALPKTCYILPSCMPALLQAIAGLGLELVIRSRSVDRRIFVGVARLCELKGTSLVR